MLIFRVVFLSLHRVAYVSVLNEKSGSDVGIAPMRHETPLVEAGEVRSQIKATQGKIHMIVQFPSFAGPPPPGWSDNKGVVKPLDVENQNWGQGF